MAFFRSGRPSAGAYFTSPVLSCVAQFTTASIGALLLGSPPPRWMTGSPLSFSRVAVWFSFSVGDSLIVLANWLMLMISLYRRDDNDLPLLIYMLSRPRVLGRLDLVAGSLLYVGRKRKNDKTTRPASWDQIIRPLSFS